jgi:hypothetical protein
MSRRVGYVTVVLVFWAGAARGQLVQLQQGTIKKVDAEHAVITIRSRGRDRDYTVTGRTRFSAGKGIVPLDLKDARLRPGARVQFQAFERKGKAYLVGLRLPLKAALVKVDTSGMRPLTELGTGTYKGFEGGLYPGGKNERPPAHEAAGLALARGVRPRDAAGRPDPGGKVVLLSVGMSNAHMAFSAFQELTASGEKNPRLVLVNGAQPGMLADRITDPDDGGNGTVYWRQVDKELKAAGVTRAQVQAAWVKEADGHPRLPFPEHARKLQGELKAIVRVLHDRFPNLKLVYVSSRTYGGYAKGPLNPEPYAYESGFAVKWLIAEQLKGDAGLNYDPSRGPVRAPWLSWGPYLWANGTAKRADGLSYRASDFAADGTHPSPDGRRKVGRVLLHFFRTDPTTRPWFVGPGEAPSPPKAPAAGSPG